LGALRERAEAAAGAAIAGGLKAYLAARPVYRFKDDVKGIVVRAALSDVTTNADTLVIKLTLTVAIGLAVLLAVVFLIAQLVRHPHWGLTILEIALNTIPPTSG
jgi:hypothetical protein